MVKAAMIFLMFMTAIDMTILATIMPYIIASLGQMQLYPFASSSFLMALVLATPIFGILADHFGIKKAAFLAIAIFLLGSFASGASQSMVQLALARFIQGAGAGGLLNICFISVAKLYSHDAHRS